jgi:putative transposase
VEDDFSRECFGLSADTSMPGTSVARELTSIIARRRKPLMIVNDNGAEWTSVASLCRGNHRRVGWHYSVNGKMTQNALADSFNGKLHYE